MWRRLRVPAGLGLATACLTAVMVLLWVSNRPENLVRQAVAAGDRGDVTTARRLLNEAIRRAPDMAEAHYHRGRLNLAQGEFAKAVEDWQTALRLGLQGAEVLEGLGVAQRLSGHPKEAVSTLTKCIRAYPECVTALGNRADAYIDMQEWALAAQDFRAAREQTCVDALTLVDAAKCEGKLGETAAAEELLHEATELEPTSGPVWDALADYWIDRGDPDQALQCASRAAEYLPHNTDPPYLKGRAYEQMGKVTEAIREYRRAYDLAPELPLLQRALGGALLKDGQYAAAGRLLTESIESRRSDPSTYELRAKCSEALGLAEQAEADRRTAAAIRARQGSSEEPEVPSGEVRSQ